MKNKFTFLLLLSLATRVLYAQNDTIANGGFERWDTFSGYANPSNWYTLNELVIYQYDPTSNLTTDAHSGNYAVVLETLTGPFSDLQGVICGGPLLNANHEPDFSGGQYPFTSKPKSIRFYYKAYPGVDDTCAMGMYLYKWNQALGISDTVAVAEMYFTDSVTTYTMLDLPFDYKLPFTPDSAFLIFSSSIKFDFPVVGGKLYIDDVELIYESTGLKDVVSMNTFSVYPNPVSNKLFVDLEKLDKATLSLYDVTGRLLHTQLVDKANRNIDLTDYQEGIYLLMLHDGQNQASYQKIIVQH